MTETWDEADSRIFLKYGRAFTPQWTRLREAFLRLVPASPDESFSCADIGAGSGWMSQAVLQRFHKAQVLAFDGSPMMLEHLRNNFRGFGLQFAAKSFELLNLAWLAQVPDGLRCAFSSLAIHHLDDADKRAVFSGLCASLSPGGAFLYADLVKPADKGEQEEFASSWDDCVQSQSFDLYGDSRAYDVFTAQRWNYYRYPDPVDKPAGLDDLLSWLCNARFTKVEVSWRCAGHVLIAASKA